MAAEIRRQRLARAHQLLSQPGQTLTIAQIAIQVGLPNAAHLPRGGWLAFLCWRTREENPVFTTGFAEAAAVLGLREKPGPLASFSPTATGIMTGLSPAQAAELTRQVRDSLAAYASPDGITMPAAGRRGLRIPLSCASLLRVGRGEVRPVRRLP